MNENDIAKLKDYCKDFATYSKNTEDGKGTSFHDIKNTFDYVIKNGIEKYQLQDTVFGETLVSNARQCANVLGDICTTLQSLEKSISAFCDAQERNNNNQVIV